ncbi:hypothetical protein M5E87_15925 [Flavonifractor plautii]|nr:hypothetical protein M5E87_15925 [Flavonifractor plautii]
MAGLLHVPDHCTVAIETALGGAMQHIVVEREEDGKAAIQYLKRRDGGRSTFLPLTTIRPSDFREQGVRGRRASWAWGTSWCSSTPATRGFFPICWGAPWWPRIWTRPSPWPANTATASKSSPWTARCSTPAAP